MIRRQDAIIKIGKDCAESGKAGVGAGQDLEVVAISYVLGLGILYLSGDLVIIHDTLFSLSFRIW